jgi:hypothetical protein
MGAAVVNLGMPTPPPAPVSIPGLYLQFPDGESLALTAETIEDRARALLSDPAKIPAHVKEAEAFQLCSICPKRGSGDTCHAIRPVMAVWEHFDRRESHDPVTVVYRSGTTGLVMSTETTVQHALQYVSILSLLYYCETGKKYWRYFSGVHPLMRTEEVVIQVYLNMFWACHGDVARTRALIATFHDEITETTRCQMDRIRLFCHSDSFLNALILTQIASEFLAAYVDDMMQCRFESFERSFFGDATLTGSSGAFTPEQ